MSELFKRLGDRLVQAGLLAQDKLDEALAQQRQKGGYLSDILVSEGLVPEQDLLQTACGPQRLRFITAERLSKARLADGVLDAVPVRVAEQLCVFPLSQDPATGEWTIAVTDIDEPLLEGVRIATRSKKIVPVVALARTIRAAIQRFYYADHYAFATVVRAAPKIARHQTGGFVLRPTPVETPVVLPGTNPELDTLRRENERLLRENKMLTVANDLQRQLSNERELMRILDRVLAFAFDHLPADEGAILVRSPDGSLVPASGRNREGTDAEITVSESLLAEVEKRREAVLAEDASVDPRFSSSQSIVAQNLRSMMGVPLLVGDRVQGVILLTARNRIAAFSQTDVGVLTHVAAQASLALQNLSLAHRVAADTQARSRLSRFLSPAVVELATSGALDLSEQGQEEVASILFADIRGFTPLAERMPPQDLVQLLNEHFDGMVDQVFAHGGVLDKFMGDGLMALFGVPLRQPDHASRALRAALGMLDAVQMMNLQRERSGRRPLEIGIGVNTGRVVFGAMGAARRLELTAIGDAVNTAARLCEKAGPGQILTTQATLAEAGSNFLVSPLDALSLKGKAQPVETFLVMSANTGDRPGEY